MDVEVVEQDAVVTAVELPLEDEEEAELWTVEDVELESMEPVVIVYVVGVLDVPVPANMT